jgi:hypothetical protein
MYRFIAILAVAFLLIGAVIFAAGWMNFHHDERKAVIEIQTGEMKEAADNAVEKGRELIHHAAEKVETSTSDSPRQP